MQHYATLESVQPKTIMTWSYFINVLYVWWDVICIEGAEDPIKILQLYQLITNSRPICTSSWFNQKVCEKQISSPSFEGKCNTIHISHSIWCYKTFISEHSGSWLIITIWYIMQIYWQGQPWAIPQDRLGGWFDLL